MYFFLEEYSTYQKHLYCKSVYCGRGSSSIQIMSTVYFYCIKRPHGAKAFDCLAYVSMVFTQCEAHLQLNPFLKMSVGNMWLQDSDLKDLCILKMICCCGFRFLHES